MAGVPISSHAADVHDSGYVSVGVPDLQQATAFFRNILDCEPIGPIVANESAEPAASANADHATRHDLPPSRLLLCDAGTVVELFDDHAVHSPSTARHFTDHGNQPIQFSTDDVTHAGQWLRREGVTVIGAPVTMTTGPHAGQTLVNFVAPWGLRLQLVGWNRSQVATAP
ncbi:MAG: VOC family protein [Rhodanobacter sp.]